MNKLFLRIAFMATLATALSLSQANAQTFINYQASIQKPDGNNKLIPIPDGSYDVTVFIYQDTTVNNKPVYAESHSNVPVKNGLVNLKIGKGSPSIFALNATFETIKWNSEKPFYVRINFPTLSINGSYQQLGSVPYALSAGSSDWKTRGDTISYSLKRIGIGTDFPEQPLTIAGNTSGVNVAAQLGIQTLSNPNSRLYLGYHPTKNYGSIQALTEGVTYRNLILNAEGGNVGIGVSNPTSKLAVDGTTVTEGLRVNGSDLSLGFTRPRGSKPNQRALVHEDGDILVLNYNGDFEGGIRVDGNANISGGLNTGGVTINLQNGNGPGGRDGLIINSSADNNSSSLITNRDLFYFYSTKRSGDADIQAGQGSFGVVVVRGADIIEKANNTEGVQAGEVVVIDPTQPNNVKRSQKAYDKTVMGVVSGAGGIKHGMQLAQEGVLDGNTNFAIAGRVYVKVTGKVKVGDLLTTSDKAGYAMAVKSMKKAFGSTIGKALSEPNAEGLVLMLVMMR
jgi:hypothetical protein